MIVFEYFPLISFLILISLISGRVVFLKRKGIKVSSGSKKISKKAFFIYPAFFPVLLMWLYELSKPAFHFSFSFVPEALVKPLTESVFLKISGVLVIAAALILLLITLLHFRNSLRFGLDEKNPGKLVTTGIFSISRNPFFLSFDLYFLGIAILLPGIFFVGFAVLTFTSIHFFILKEEKFMQGVYGDEYLEYKRKVRRYL